MAEGGEEVTPGKSSRPGELELGCMNCEEGRKTETAHRASHSTRIERPAEQVGAIEN